MIHINIVLNIVVQFPVVKKRRLIAHSIVKHINVITVGVISKKNRALKAAQVITVVHRAVRLHR